MNIVNKVIFNLSLILSSVVYSQPLMWEGNTFSLNAKKMTISSVLESLADNYDTPINIAPSVVGEFSGMIEPAPPLAILNHLMNQYNLIWYFDGNSLFIYPTSSLERKVISLNALNVANFMRYLQQRQVAANKSCEIQRVPGANALDVNGIPICLDRITQLASMLDGQIQKQKDDEVSIKVYPLRYASAVDSQYQYRDQTVVVPGIVSVLREMSQGSPATLTPTGKGGESPSVGLPSFAADPRQNAVIVRDRASEIGVYKNLIAALDLRPEMIEISVSIIDVDAGNVRQLGIDWSATIPLGRGQVSFNSATGANTFSTVISNTPDFMVRLNALEKTSRARVLSQPSVVTLNNIQAVLDKNITFYTKLEGEKVAKLESITTGSLLRVTPRLLLDDKGEQNIMLSLNIQDGQQDTALSQEEPLPEIQNSEISSQATLKAGQSLLLGGFVQDKQIQSKNKIPFLGDIPLLGNLFNSDVSQTHSVVRLFLIKASVADNGSLHGR